MDDVAALLALRGRAVVGVRVRATIGRSLWAAALAAIAAAALFPVPSVLAAPNLSLAPPSGLPGTSVVATANGFLSGPVTFWWDNELLLGTDPSGRVRRLTFQVPAGAGVGAHVVRACAGSACPPGAEFADATFTIPGTPTPPPTPRPTPTLRATPRPAPTPAATPAAVATPKASLAEATAALGSNPVASPDSSAVPGGVVVPSADPASDPHAPGTVKVQFHWDRVAIGLGLGLGLLLVVLLVARTTTSSWFRVHVPGPAAPKLYEMMAKGKHDPPKPAPLPPELPVMASLVESSSGLPDGMAQSALSSSTSPEGGGASQSEPDTRTGAASLMNAALLDGAVDVPGGELQAPPSDTASPGDADVKLKGSKIKGN